MKTANLNQGWFCPSRHLCQCLETFFKNYFWLLPLGCYCWHLVGRGQGCKASYNIWVSSLNEELPQCGEFEKSCSQRRCPVLWVIGDYRTYGLIFTAVYEPLIHPAHAVLVSFGTMFLSGNILCLSTGLHGFLWLKKYQSMLGDFLGTLPNYAILTMKRCALRNQRHVNSNHHIFNYM